MHRLLSKALDEPASFRPCFKKAFRIRADQGIKRASMSGSTSTTFEIQKRPAKFSTVDQLRPDTSGHNLKVKVPHLLQLCRPDAICGSLPEARELHCVTICHYYLVQAAIRTEN